MKNETEQTRAQIFTALLEHFFEKQPDGFNVMVLLPIGTMRGPIRRGPVPGSYQLLEANVGGQAKQLEFKSLYITADLILAMEVLEEPSRIVKASMTDILRGQ